MSSRSACDDEDYEVARKRGIQARNVSFAGLMLNVLIVLIIVIYMTVSGEDISIKGFSIET